MGLNGIPQAFTPNNLAQKVANLDRKVEQLTSSRTFVNLANITVTEGGTIDSGVGDKLTETVKDKIVIDGGNLGEGALDGQRMVGAIIETNDAANRGVKIDDAGLRGYDADGNRYMKADETGLEMTGSISTKGKTNETTPRDISVSMTTVSRDAMGNVAPNPGIIFEVEGANRALSPGVYSPDGKSLYLGSTSTTGTGLLILGPATSLSSQEIKLGGTIFGALVDINTPGNTVTVGVQAGSLGGTNANVNLLGNVKVNGAAYGAPQARVQAPLSAGWSHVTSNGWNGLWVEQMGKWTTITGCVQKSSYAWNDIIATLPAQYRPANKAPGMNCEIDTAGSLLPGTAGTGARNISISYYSA